jgi:hypothetical protein
MDTVDRTPRCSTVARRCHIDPAGTAGSYDGILLVPAPLPWPRDIGELSAPGEKLRTVRAEYGGRWRLQAVVAGTGETTLTEPLVYVRPDGPFRGFRAVGPAPRKAVIVCTHGSRDRCCGSLGTRLFQQLPSIPEVAFWRTSHTGGHRFAPTAMIVPEGTAWAFLDRDLLMGIAQRTISVEEAAPHYRGCMGLAGPEAQVAEREAFVQHGWRWLDMPRTVRLRCHADTPLTVDIATAGARHVVELETYESAPIVQSCHEQADAAVPQQQWRAVSFG